MKEIALLGKDETTTQKCFNCKKMFKSGREICEHWVEAHEAVPVLRFDREQVYSLVKDNMLY